MARAAAGPRLWPRGAGDPTTRPRAALAATSSPAPSPDPLTPFCRRATLVYRSALARRRFTTPA
jgi:hypothetical protein